MKKWMLIVVSLFLLIGSAMAFENPYKLGELDNPRTNRAISCERMSKQTSVPVASFNQKAVPKQVPVTYEGTAGAVKAN